MTAVVLGHLPLAIMGIFIFGLLTHIRSRFTMIISNVHPLGLLQANSYMRAVRAVTSEDYRNANMVHQKKEQHKIDWDRARIVDREKKWKERKIKESIYIRSKGTYNLDSGFSLNPIWNPLIGHFSEQLL